MHCRLFSPVACKGLLGTILSCILMVCNLAKKGDVMFSLSSLFKWDYNFTPPKVLTWTTSPKGEKNWVLVSCLL